MKPYLLLALLILASPAAAASAPDPVIVRVNGVPVQRDEVARRLWLQYGDAVFGQIVDEILVRQEAGARKIKADPKELEVRLKRIQGQFPDEATFKKKLEGTGTSLDSVRAQLEQQLLRETLVIRAKKISVTDEEAKAFFEQNKARLGTAESVRLRHILVSDEKQAGDFLVAVRAGADFAKLASQVSSDNATKDKGGDLGLISRGMLQPELEKVVFALKAGEVSAVVRTPLGFHIFKAEEVRAPRSAAFEDVKGELKAGLLGDKVTKEWPAYMQGLREKAKIEPTSRTP